MEVLFLLSALNGADVEMLRAESWEQRETAQARLSARGVFAVPELLRAARESESPEVRQRCHELLVPYQRTQAKLRAIAVLSGPFLPGESAFFHDKRLRCDVFRLAREAGCFDYSTWHLPFQFQRDDELSAGDLMERLTEYRRQLGYHRETWALIGEAIACGGKP